MAASPNPAPVTPPGTVEGQLLRGGHLADQAAQNLDSLSSVGKVAALEGNGVEGLVNRSSSSATYNKSSRSLTRPRLGD